MNSDLGKIDRIIDEHREYLERIGNGIAEALWEGVKEGVTKGSKRGVREGLRECLAQGFMNIGEGAIEDLAGYISELAISRDVTKGTGQIIETTLGEYLGRLSDGIIDRIRSHELVLALGQTGYVVGLIKGRQQMMGQMIGDKLPRNPLSSAIVAGVQTALDEGLDASIQGFRTKIEEWLEGRAEGRTEEPARPITEYETKQLEYLKAPIREPVARVVEEAVYGLTKRIASRVIANLKKELKEKAVHGLEKSLEKTAEQELEKSLDEGIRLLTEEMAKGSPDTMSFLTDIDGSFGNSLSDYLSSLPKGPRFPFWKTLLIGAGVLAAAIVGAVYALPPGTEGPEAVASVDWTDGFTVGFSSEGSYAPDGYIESHHWDFGDRDTSEEPSPVHEYELGGEYIVVLTVTDDEGATDEDVVHVYVPYGGIPMPDLVITEVWLTGDIPYEVTVHYLIKNQGEEAAGPSITVLHSGDEVRSEDQVDSLAPGEMEESRFPTLYELTWDEVSQFWLYADGAHTVDESNEENNSMAYE